MGLKMDKKIIMFEDNETHEVSIECNFQFDMMNFSRGFTDDDEYPEHMINLEKRGKWQFEGTFHHKTSNIEEIWNAGKTFENNPERIKKEAEAQRLITEIERAQKLIKDCENELKKL
jgi:hypothetical protein